MRFSSAPISRLDHEEIYHVPTYREVKPQLVVELRRARRYELPLGVVTLSLRVPARADDVRLGDGPPDDASALGADLFDVPPAAYGLLGVYLRNVLRETDILAGVPECMAFAAFLPCTELENAERALGRFRSGFQTCAGFAVRGGVAAFPADGLTIDDVLDAACNAWRGARRRDESAPADVPRADAPVRYSHG